MNPWLACCGIIYSLGLIAIFCDSNLKLCIPSFSKIGAPRDSSNKEADLDRARDFSCHPILFSIRFKLIKYCPQSLQTGATSQILPSSFVDHNSEHRTPSFFSASCMLNEYDQIAQHAFYPGGSDNFNIYMDHLKLIHAHQIYATSSI